MAVTKEKVKPVMNHKKRSSLAYDIFLPRHSTSASELTSRLLTGEEIGVFTPKMLKKKSSSTEKKRKHSQSEERHDNNKRRSAESNLEVRC